MSVSYNDVLNEFVKILHVLNYSGKENPTKDEYVPEALSLLARLVESQIQINSNKSQSLNSTKAIIDNTFIFWNDEKLPEGETINLAMNLLDVFHPTWGDNENN